MKWEMEKANRGNQCIGALVVYKKVSLGHKSDIAILCPKSDKSQHSNNSNLEEIRYCHSFYFFKIKQIEKNCIKPKFQVNWTTFRYTSGFIKPLTFLTWHILDLLLPGGADLPPSF